MIGDKLSHNTKKLADIIAEYSTNVYLVESITDVPNKSIKSALLGIIKKPLIIDGVSGLVFL